MSEIGQDIIDGLKEFKELTDAIKQSLKMPWDELVTDASVNVDEDSFSWWVQFGAFEKWLSSLGVDSAGRDRLRLYMAFVAAVKFGAKQATSIKCPKCDGSGAAGVDRSSGEEIECHYCDGRGQITADEHIQLTDRFDEMSADYMVSDHLNAERIQRLEDALRAARKKLEIYQPHVSNFKLFSYRQLIDKIDAALKGEAE